MYCSTGEPLGFFCFGGLFIGVFLTLTGSDDIYTKGKYKGKHKNFINIASRLFRYHFTILPALVHALHAGPSQQNNKLIILYNYKYAEHMHVTSTVGELVS